MIVSLLVSVSLFVSFDGLVVLSRSCVQIWLFADIYLLYVLDTILCAPYVRLSWEEEGQRRWWHAIANLAIATLLP